MIPTLLLDAVRMVVPCNAMAEVLGHKSLLGLAVVVVWLLLFHLLVNIWLLCMFTSLLVVLGGWLGSQAVLESNSVIHLERFITLQQIPSSVEDEQHLDQEIHNTVRKIIRDFVSSWYSTISSERHFETEVQEAMVSMAMELKLRARQVDRKELTERLLNLFGSHLQDYINAKELVKEQQISMNACPSSEGEQLLEAYFNITSPHLAMMSSSEGINYVRAMVDLLLHILVPAPHLKSRTGRFVVGELITCNVMQPLIEKLSNPDWLNILIIEIFGKSIIPQELTASTVSPPQALRSPDQASLPAVSNVSQSSVVTQEQAEAEVISVNKMPIPELAACDMVDAEEVDFPTNNAEDETAQPILRSSTRGRKLNPFYQEYDSDLDSPLAEDKRRPIDSLVVIDQEEIPDDKKKQCSITLESNNGVDLEDVYASPVDGSCPKVIVNSEPVAPPNGCGSTSVSLAAAASANSTFQDVERDGDCSALNPNQELVLGGDQTVMGNPNELTVISPLHTCSPMGTFSFEPLSSPEGPVIIQNLRITGTITAKEHRGTGSHPYTLYTIKYETAMGFENQESSHSSSEDVEAGSTCCENTPSIHPVAYHMVNRRYSEFLNLQTRLEEKGDLRKLIKGVKGPKKVFPEMPFGNMDSDKIEARKGLLETFLKQLCTMPEIANSEEMQEFLALNTDARIAFVKKPFIASRIDKFVVNAIVDTLKTAFPRSEPQSPTEDDVDIDGAKLSVDKKSRSRLRFSSKNISFMNDADIRSPVLFSLEQTDMVFKGVSLEVLQTFISEQEKQSVEAEADSESTTLRRAILSKREKYNNKHGSETALAEVALNILCLLMNEQWSWLCTENIQKTIRLLFGTLINRWLDVRVANLMSARHWAIYLRVMQEAVWPGGSLPKTPRPERSQQQKDNTKQRALHCLMSLVPDLVSDMLGSEKYKISWQIVLESFQDKRINRHLVYCIFDLLLEVVVPEIPDEAFQRSMLQSLSKNPEKLLA